VIHIYIYIYIYLFIFFPKIVPFIDIYKTYGTASLAVAELNISQKNATFIRVNYETTETDSHYV
jgi:hypothetical protein